MRYFFHCDVLTRVYSVAFGFVPLPFGDVCDSVFPFSLDFVTFAEVADGFGAHSGHFSKLVEGVPLFCVGVIGACEDGFHHVLFVEVAVANDAWFDLMTFDC